MRLLLYTAGQKILVFFSLFSLLTYKSYNYPIKVIPEGPMEEYLLFGFKEGPKAIEKLPAYPQPQLSVAHIRRRKRNMFMKRALTGSQMILLQLFLVSGLPTKLEVSIRESPDASRSEGLEAVQHEVQGRSRGINFEKKNLSCSLYGCLCPFFVKYH